MPPKLIGHRQIHLSRGASPANTRAISVHTTPEKKEPKAKEDISSVKTSTELEMASTEPTTVTKTEETKKESSDVIAASSAAAGVGAAAAAPVEPINHKNIVVEHEFASKTTARTTTIMSDGINFLRTVASDILDKIVVGDTPIVVVAMELVQWAEKNMKQFSGQEKKRIVLKLLNWLIDNQEDVLNNALGESVEGLHMLVDTVVPSILDAVCAAAKGKYDINIPKKAVKGCLAYICGL